MNKHRISTEYDKRKRRREAQASLLAEPNVMYTVFPCLLDLHLSLHL